MTSLWCRRCKRQAPAAEWQRVMHDVGLQRYVIDVYKHRPPGRKCQALEAHVRMYGRGKLATA